MTREHDEWNDRGKIKAVASNPKSALLVAGKEFSGSTGEITRETMLTKSNGDLRSKVSDEEICIADTKAIGDVRSRVVEEEVRNENASATTPEDQVHPGAVAIPGNRSTASVGGDTGVTTRDDTQDHEPNNHDAEQPVQAYPVEEAEEEKPLVEAALDHRRIYILAAVLAMAVLGAVAAAVGFIQGNKSSKTKAQDPR